MGGYLVERFDESWQSPSQKFTRETHKLRDIHNTTGEGQMWEVYFEFEFVTFRSVHRQLNTPEWLGRPENGFLEKTWSYRRPPGSPEWRYGPIVHPGLAEWIP